MAFLVMLFSLFDKNFIRDDLINLQFNGGTPVICTISSSIVCSYRAFLVYKQLLKW